MTLISNRFVVGALVLASMGLFASCAVLAARNYLRAAWDGVRTSFRPLRSFEKLLLGLAIVSTCLVGDGKIGGGGRQLAQGGASESRAHARRDGANADSGSETGRFFRVDAFALMSNRVEIGAAWSAGYFATGSVVNLYGRFGALTNESELLGSVVLDGASVSGTVFSVMLDEPVESAAFFRLTSPCDADGDGLLDWFEANEFGSDPNNPDTDGDGFPDSAEYVLGSDPSETVVPQIEVYSAGVSACRVTEGFSAGSTNGLTGPVFSRTLALPRQSTFTQYFLSADPMGPRSINASGFEVEYFDDSGRTGRVHAAELEGGIRLPCLSTNLNSVTVRLTAVSDGLWCSNALHLVSYRPEIVLDDAQTVSANNRFAASDILVVIGTVTSVTFNYSERPSSEPISEEEDRANPFEGIEGLTYDPDAHRLTADNPGVYDMPDGRTLIFLSPSVTYGYGHGFTGARVYYNSIDGSYDEEPPYPLDTACLHESWSEGVDTSDGCSCVPDVRSGLESGEADPRVTAECESADGETATGVVRVNRTVVWRGTATHSRYVSFGGASDVLSGDPCASCSADCKDGNCDALEGPSLGSIRFRIPLGNSEAEHISGFLYFVNDRPFVARAADFRLLGRSDAWIEDETAADGVRTVFCLDNRGRTVRLSDTANGVEIGIFDESGVFEHSWEIFTVGDAMRFRKISRIDNVMLDKSYVFGDGAWSEVDNISGLETELRRTGSIDSPDGRTEERIMRDGGTVVSRVLVRSELVGSEDAAVVREVERRELSAGNIWKVSHAAYWDDSSCPRRHGALKLEWGDDRPWRYCAYDDEGREVFRLDQRNGSPVVDADWDWSMSHLPDEESFATVCDYTPLPGDDRNVKDADKVRTESRYVVRNGMATLIGRTWRMYVRGEGLFGDTVEVTTVRAASPEAGVDDAANAVTVETRYDDESWNVPYVVRGELCSRIDADGTETRRYGWYDGSGIRTEERRYLNGVEAETYRVTVRDETYGNVLYEATALTEDDTEFDWMSHVYDEKNRLVFTQYADGSSETNAYSCCRLLWSVDRTGAKTLRSATTGTDHLYYAEEEVSITELPHDTRLLPEGWDSNFYDQGFRATQHFLDSLGRETNVVVRSGKFPGNFTDPSHHWNLAHQELHTHTTYPQGVSDSAVTVDPAGRTTTVFCGGTSASEVTDTVEYDRGSAVPVAETVLEAVRGGGTFELRTMADGEWTLSSRFDEYDDTGCRMSFDVLESSDCGTVTNRIDRYDFLGRLACSETPQSVVSNLYIGASDRVLSSVDSVSGRVTTNLFDAVGELVGVSSRGVESRSETSYAVADGALWRVDSDIVTAGAVMASCSTVRTRLTGLSDARRSETIREDDGTEVEREVSSFNAATKVLTTTVSSSKSGETVVRSMFGRETERDAPDGQYRNSFDPWGRVFVIQRTKSDGTGLDYYRAVDCDELGRETVRYDMSGYKPNNANRRWNVYDCRGNLVAVTNALGDVVFYAYDGENRLTGESGDAYRVRYGYDTAGRRTSLETTRDGDAFDRTEWTYDSVTGSCLTKTYADRSQTTYSHTADGLPLRTVYPTGHWTENVYGENRRLVGVDSDDVSCRAELVNDVFGRPVSAVSSAASYAYRLSGRAIATNEQVTIGGASFALRRTLDPFGRIAGVSFPGSAATSITYSDCGRIAMVSNDDAVVAYAYDLLNSDVGFALTLANGRTFLRTLTRPVKFHDDQVTSVTNISGASTNVYGYTYDKLYRPLTRNADNFSYNRRGEVAAATVAGESSAYAYDGIGNFTFVVGGAVTNVYAANELNQYDEVTDLSGTLEPTYTANGELASFGPWTYAYDALSRLTAAYSNGTLVVSNRYDHLGRRVQKITPDGTHTFLYDGWRPVLETVSRPGGTDRIEYHWGKDLSGTLDGAAGVGGLLYVKRNGAIYVPFYDAFGNVMGYWDENGAVVASYAYDAFGRTVAKSGTMADVFPMRYSTKYFDTETGMYYYGKRFYLLALCRWLTRDPIEEEGGVNLYGFCGNDGVSKLDADGRAYFAYRPLSAPIFNLFVLGNAQDEVNNTMVAHEQLFFEDGGIPTNLGYFSDSTVHSDLDIGRYRLAHSRGWNDCIMRKAVALVIPRPYRLLDVNKHVAGKQYNCQDWAEDVRWAYYCLQHKIPYYPAGNKLIGGKYK